jgi:hypothetical protein
VVGIVLGTLGVAAIVTLAVVGVRARRRYRARLAAITPPPLPLPDPQTPSGLVWYEVTAPETSELAPQAGPGGSPATSDPAFASGGGSSDRPGGSS